MTDWLDDVLQQRPVDDDGFTARVTRLANAQRAWHNVARRLLLLAAVVAVLAAGRSCVVDVNDLVHAWSWSSTGSADAEQWLDANRARVHGAVRALDAIPQLARRDGPDAAAVLEEAMTTNNHAVLSGLARYGVWNAESGTYPVLLKLARAHLKAAMAAPLVEGEPAPFVAAAQDVEALGRLQLTRTGSFEFFEVVNAATVTARAQHTDGGFTPALDAATIEAAQRVRELLWLYTSPAARDEDFAMLRDTRSVLVCGLVRGRNTYHQRMQDFLDPQTVARPATLAMPGCAEPIALSAPCENVGLVGLLDVSNDDTNGCLAYTLTTLPPWRGMVRDSWYRLDAAAADALVERLP